MTDTAAPDSLPKTPEYRPRMGERLLELGLISRDQLAVVLHEKQRSNKMLGTLLVEFGFITQDALSAALAERTGLEQFDIDTTFIDPEVTRRIPRDVALKHRVLLMSLSGETALVAMADPLDVLAMDVVRRYLPRGAVIAPRVSTPVAIAESIDRDYGYEMSIDGILTELSTGEFDKAGDLTGPDEGYTHPVVRLVNAILLDAVKLGVSDIHFEPEELFLRIRYRIDGVMSTVKAFHKDHWPPVAHRLKILAGMNIADRLNPQDGRFSMVLGNREIDFRASTMPISHGENIVLRVLDRNRALRNLGVLGFSSHNLDAVMRLILRPQGIIIVTGPTGSGKTTTLYAMLQHRNTPAVNIMTLEDPVEYSIPLMRQGQVREPGGLSFDEGVRAILRQDPDIVFLGEVRDAKAAGMALRAAMTGHQVYTTLHTNDAIGAIPRLLDLELNPGLLAGNIIGVVAQRLVRLLCPLCKRARPPIEPEIALFGADAPVLVHDPVGCPACNMTGYQGRTLLSEVLSVTEALDDLIGRGAGRMELLAVARSEGMRDMLADGLGLVAEGVIGFESLSAAVDLSRLLPLSSMRR